VKALLAELVAEYHRRGVRLDEIAGGFVFRTSPLFAPFVREQVAKKPVKMSRAQLETLAIVAYRQPITRPEIDEVRGVDSGAVLKSLLERELVRILGKKDEPGRPMLYGTTGVFLEFFGLKALGDLPTLREFTELTDESKRAYERELGEEPEETGLMGGEGQMRREVDVKALEEDPTVDAGGEKREEEKESEAEREREDEGEREGEDEDEDEEDEEDEDEDDEEDEDEDGEDEDDEDEDDEDEDDEDEDEDEDEDDEDEA
jgi:segregation and condensation protein B